MNLILCGMMGAGKTSVGVRIAEKPAGAGMTPIR